LPTLGGFEGIPIVTAAIFLVMLELEAEPG
jgi:hypothetical protein